MFHVFIYDQGEWHWFATTPRSWPRSWVDHWLRTKLIPLCEDKGVDWEFVAW